MKEYNKMTWEVYKNGKLENAGGCDAERVKDELINDFISAYFYKRCKISFINYDEIKVQY